MSAVVGWSPPGDLATLADEPVWVGYGGVDSDHMDPFVLVLADGDRWSWNAACGADAAARFAEANPDAALVVRALFQPRPAASPCWLPGPAHPSDWTRPQVAS